ncbi:MAG: glycosyltransferase family 2 protein, partial [Cyclobacteriaceae bacterium]|nr:glycosyltransferase family 2 protein [Cyclobacteriaceae bacterium]
MNEEIRVIIPAYNEERSITKVIEEIPAELVKEIIVVDNGSEDHTAEIAQKAGAMVLTEPAKGYGNACLKGMSYIKKTADDTTEIIVFLDGDHADYPEEMDSMITLIRKGRADLVIGSRALGNREAGSMTPQQIVGNWLATWLMKLIYHADFTDLGPFRAIRWNSLKDLGMQDKNYGWTIEMQIKAIKKGLKCMEVPVGYRRRIGVSKVSGTL